MIDQIAEYYRIFNEKNNIASYVVDGVNDEYGYSNTNIKILWVLKEAHSQDRNESWDHRGFHCHSLLNYKYWKKTYGPIIRISFALQKKYKNETMVKPIEDFTSDEVYSIMRSIAIINVKKNAGGSRSNYSTIKGEYVKHKDILQQQILTIAPSILINCSGIWELNNDHMPNALNKYVNKFEAWYDNACIGVKAYHPQCSYRNYAKDIISIVNECKT